ncbi:MAG: nucleoside-diphosphate-sugar epimerase [Arcticibacterium sp.]|jgi:nucleoside-diphosphate-sugar epimerase
MMSFAEHFDAAYYEVVGLSRQQDLDSRFRWISGSIIDLARMNDVLAEIDILVHGAAITHAFSEKEYLDVNYNQSIELIKNAVAAGVKKVIYVSSRTAGMESGGYGKSKIMAENFIKTHCKDWLIFRPAEVFGGSKNEGIEKLIDDALKKMFIFYPSGGEQMFPIDLADTAKIMYEESSKSQELIIIGGHEGYNYPDLIKKIAAMADKFTFAIPIPKLCMFALAKLVKVFSLKIGMVPDQVDRFYAKKTSQKLPYHLKPFGAYLEEKVNSFLPLK